MGDLRAGAPLVLAVALAACGGGPVAAATSAVASSSIGAGGSGEGGYHGFGGFGGGAPGGGPPFVILSASVDGGAERDPALVRAPGGQLVASWTASPPSGPTRVDYAFSSDDGTTWSAPAGVAPVTGSASDADVAADAQSNVALVFAAEAPAASGIFVTRAQAPAQSFAAPVEITDPAANAGYDGPRIVRLASGSLLVTYGETAPDGQSAGVAATTQDGVTWARTDIVRGAQVRSLFAPCASGATGRVWVAFHTLGGIFMRHSDDGGATWTTADAPVSLQGEAVAFARPRCAAAGDAVWVAYGLSKDAASPTSDPVLTSLRLARAVGDGPVEDHVDVERQGVPALAMKPELVDRGGELLLTYYAGAEPGDPHGAVIAQQGNPCVPWRVLHADVAFEPSRASLRWAGERSGLATSDTSLLATFVDTASGSAHVAFAKLPLLFPPCGGP